VLRSAADIENDPDRLAIFTNAQDKIIPDPLTYSEWFRQAGEQRRRIAVGTKRYSAVKDKLGAHPSWEDFLDPQTGDLVTVNQLKNEDRQQRAERVQKVRTMMQRSRKLLKQTTVYGFAKGA